MSEKDLADTMNEHLSSLIEAGQDIKKPLENFLINHREEIINKMELKTEQPKFRLNRKVNFKGEKALEYTLRAETIEELKELEKQIKEYLEE